MTTKLPVFLVISYQVGSFHNKPIEVFLDKESAEARQAEIRELDYMQADLLETTATGKLYISVLRVENETPEVYTDDTVANERYDELAKDFNAEMDTILANTTNPSIGL